MFRCLRGCEQGAKIAEQFWSTAPTARATGKTKCERQIEALQHLQLVASWLSDADLSLAFAKRLSNQPASQDDSAVLRKVKALAHDIIRKAWSPSNPSNPITGNSTYTGTVQLAAIVLALKLMFGDVTDSNNLASSPSTVVKEVIAECASSAKDRVSHWEAVHVWIGTFRTHLLSCANSLASAFDHADGSHGNMCIAMARGAPLAPGRKPAARVAEAQRLANAAALDDEDDDGFGLVRTETPSPVLEMAPANDAPVPASDISAEAAAQVDTAVRNSPRPLAPLPPAPAARGPQNESGSETGDDFDGLCCDGTGVVAEDDVDTGILRAYCGGCPECTPPSPRANSEPSAPAASDGPAPFFGPPPGSEANHLGLPRIDDDSVQQQLEAALPGYRKRVADESVWNGEGMLPPNPTLQPEASASQAGGPLRKRARTYASAMLERLALQADKHDPDEGAAQDDDAERAVKVGVLAVMMGELVREMEGLVGGLVGGRGV